MSLLDTIAPPWMQILKALREKQPQLQQTPMGRAPMAPAAPGAMPGLPAPAQAPQNPLAGLLGAPVARPQDLLTKQDRTKARERGFLTAGLAMMEGSGQPGSNILREISRGVQAGVGGYSGYLQQAGQDRAEQQKLQQQRARQQLMQQIPLPSSADPVAMREWLGQIVPALAAVQDFDAVKALGPLVEKYGPKEEKPHPYQMAQQGDKATTFNPNDGTFYNPKTGKWERSVENGLSEDRKAENEANRDLRRVQLEAARAQREAAAGTKDNQRLERISTRFERATKDLVERGRLIHQAELTLDQAAHNPDPNARKVLFSSAVANFVQAADQKAQLRWQLLNYFKSNVDASLAGRWDIIKERATKGQLPLRVMEGMLAHIRDLGKMTRSEYENRRAADVRRNPELDEQLYKWDELFDGDVTTAPPPDAAHTPDALAKRYGAPR